jgi:hypothetical protein
MTIASIKNYIPGMTSAKIDEVDAELAKIPQK